MTMNAAMAPRALRWFFLIWIGTIFIEGTIHIVETTSIICTAKNAGVCHADTTPFASLLVVQLAFTVLMMLFYGVLWFNMSRLPSDFFLGRLFPIQGLLIVAIFLIVRREEIALDLYLALALVTIIVCSQPNRVVIISIASGYLLLLFAMFCVLWFVYGPVEKLFSGVLLPDLPQYCTQILFLIGYMLLYQQIIRSQAELRTSNEHIAVLTQLTERQRMARELHDTLVQGLTGVILQLEAVQAGLRQQRYERVQAIVSRALSDVRGSLTDARMAIQDLRVTSLEAATLSAIIRRELAHFATMTGIEYTADLAGLAALPDASCEHILRMLTESLTNVVRHAHATHIEIETNVDSTQVNIVVHDNGIGFAPARVARETGHYGLVGMQERARAINGQITVVSAPTRGTTISIHVPRSIMDDEGKITSSHGRYVDA